MRDAKSLQDKGEKLAGCTCDWSFLAVTRVMERQNLPLTGSGKVI